MGSRGTTTVRLLYVNDHHDDAQHFHDDSEHDLDDHDHGSRDHHDIRVLGRRSPGGLRCQANGVKGVAAVTVASELPFTGFPAWILAVAGAMLLLSGLGLRRFVKQASPISPARSRPAAPTRAWPTATR